MKGQKKSKGAKGVTEERHRESNRVKKKVLAPLTVQDPALTKMLRLEEDLGLEQKKKMENGT